MAINNCNDCGVLLTEDNTYSWAKRLGKNKCIECQKEYSRNWYRIISKKDPNFNVKLATQQKERRIVNKLNNFEEYVKKEHIDNLKYRVPNYRKVIAEHMKLDPENMAGKEVHHIDLNPENNNIENLLLLNTKMHGCIHGKLEKGIKPIQKVYLQGPIDGVSSGEANGWRDIAYDYLATRGIISLVPGKETRGLLTPQEIVDLDTCMIENADAILVNLEFLLDPTKGRGTGTLVELGIALANNKPIIAFLNSMDSKFMEGLFVRGVCSQVFFSMEEALEVLVSINNGASK